MPVFDRQCSNGHTKLDCIEPSVVTVDPVCACGEPMKRVWMQRANAVKDDSIPGGVWIEHGLCNPDGTARRYDSYSDIRREAAARGLIHASEAESVINIVDLTDYSDPQVQLERRKAMADHLGLTLDQYDQLTRVRVAPKVDQRLSATEFEMRRECSIAELHGVSADRPGSEQQYLRNREERG